MACYIEQDPDNNFSALTAYLNVTETRHELRTNIGEKL